MSWWISLTDDDGATPQVERFVDGGTYAVGGVDEADLNVTYNYGCHFAFGSLHERRAGETIAGLEKAVAELGTERDDDYWKPTKGNAGAACSRLLAWARQHPGCVWEVI